MQLNETAAKLDQQIDIACKKYEKLCFDNGAQELIYKDDQTDKTSKLKSSYLLPSFDFSAVQGLHQKLRVELQEVQH